MAKDLARERQSPSEEVAPSPTGGVVCPFCGSSETELFSQFGSMLMSSQHYCRNCRTVFDRVRWDRR